MVDFKLNKLCFTFPNGKTALENISLEIKHGEFVVLCGKSGSGKTTLLKMLKPELSPHGKSSGTVEIFGAEKAVLSRRSSAEKIGYIMQNTELQAVTPAVKSELFFGLENLGLAPGKARLRVAETAALFSLEKLLEKKISSLSGGQKQLVNLASVCAMNPQVLLLDEPTAQLDPVCAQRLIDVVTTLCREYGVTVVISEHRLEKLLPLADRVLVLEDGKLASNSAPQEIDAEVVARNEFIRSSLPFPMRLYFSLGFSKDAPTDIESGRKWLYSLLRDIKTESLPPEKPPEKRETAVRVKNLFYSYDGKEYVLKGLSTEIKQGSFFAVLGANSAGKTTLLNLIGGLLKAKKGKIELFSKDIGRYNETGLYRKNVAFLPQNCETLFAGPTVFEDLENVLLCEKLSKQERQRLIFELSAFCGIEPLLKSHPYDLSGGELQRAALAMVLLKKPRLLLLDEPTKGMDSLFKAQLAKKLRSLCKSGVTVVMVSHDTEFCAEYCDECALLFDGRCAFCGGAREFFAENCYYTTAASKMTRGIFKNAVRESEVLALCKKNLAR